MDITLLSAPTPVRPGSESWLAGVNPVYALVGGVVIVGIIIMFIRRTPTLSEEQELVDTTVQHDSWHGDDAQSDSDGPADVPKGQV